MNAVPAAVLSVLVQARGIKQTNTGLAAVHGGMERAGRAGTAMGSRIARGAKIAAAGLAVMLGLGFGSAISKGIDFEKRMDSLGAVMEATSKQSQKLERQALRQGEATAYSANEVAEAQVELAKGGLKAEQILGGALPAALSLAAAGELELAEAATTTVNAMKLFGLEGRESQRVADMMATAANTTTADVLDFAMAIRQGGSAAKQAGLDLNESMVILESLAEAGIKNSDAGTSMKAALIQLLKPTEKQANLAEKLGIQWESQNGTIKSAVGLSRELRQATDDMTKAERVKTLAILAGTDGFRTLAALYDAGPKKLRELSIANQQAGTAQEVAGKKMNNLAGDVDELGGAVETLQIKLMGGASPALRNLTQDLTGMVQEISRIASNPALTEEQKFTRIFDLIADASGAALTEVVQQAARFGPRFVSALASSIAREWMEMSPLAKVLSVAVLVRTLGGKGAITATGAAIGRWLGLGISTGIATEVAASAPLTAAAAATTGAVPAAAAGAAAGWNPKAPALGSSAARQAAATSTSRALLAEAFGGMTLAAAGASMEKAAKPGLWKRVSAKLGGQLGTATGAVAGGSIASGIVSKLGGFRWGRIGGLGLGIWAADETIKEFGRRADERSADLTKALGAIGDRGLIAEAATLASPYGNSGRRSEEAMAQNLLSQYEEMATKRVRISLATEESLRSQARELDLTKEQTVQLESMFNLMRLGRDLDIKVGLGLDAGKLNELKNGFGVLRSGVLTSMADINKVVKRNSASIASTLGTSSREGRDKVAENYRAAALAIGKAMANGDISIKQGLRRQKELFRNAKLISGDDPLGIARGFAASWKKAGSINSHQRQEMIADLGKMPPAARQKAFEAMVKYGQGLVKGGKIPKQDLRDFKSAALAQFSDLRSKGTQSSLDLAIGVAGNFGSMGEAVANVLRIIQENSNNALTKFGAKKLSFVVKAVGSMLGFGGGKEQKKQAGGFIVPGSGSGDRPGFMGEVGAFVLNREATRAYGFNKGGMVPLALEPGERYFSRREVTAMGGAGRLEALNRSVPRFQKGGEIGGKPQITGPAGPLRDIGQGVADEVWSAAKKYTDKHAASFGPASAAGAGKARSYPGLSGDTDFAIALGERLSALAKATVGHISVTSGWRSRAEQAALYAKYGSPRAAPPGRSNHEDGRAADISPDRPAYGGQERRFGLHFPMSWEPWHIELMQLGGLIRAMAGGGVVETMGAVLRNHGYDLEAAAGVAGNSWQESKWNPGAIEPGTHNGGLFGFTTYPVDLQSVKNAAAGAGVPWTNTKLQTQFMIHNGEPTGMELRSKLNAAESIADTTRIFMNEWERPGIPAESNRIAGARKALPILEGVYGAKGGAGLTEGQKKAAEGKKRKANYEERLRKLEQEANQARSAPARQSKLWRLIKMWGRVGIFDEGERSHIIDAVQRAAAQRKPQGAVNVLSGLASFAKSHGEITGQDPSNFRSLERAIERAQDRGRDQREKSVERHRKQVERVKARVASKIENRAAFPDWVAQLAGLRRRADEGEEFASQLVTLEPENLSDAYVGQERASYGDNLNRLLAWRNTTIRAQDAASREIANFEAQIESIEALNIGVEQGRAVPMGKGRTKRLGGLVEFLAAGGQSGGGRGKRRGKGGPGAPSDTFAQYKKAAYKIPLLEEAIANAKTMRDETWAAELEEIQGLTGPRNLLDSLPSEPQAGAFGGRIFEIQNAIRELGLKVNDASSGVSELKQLEAQLNIDWHKRFLVSEAQRNTIRDFETTYGAGRFAGMFAAGGYIGRGQWGIAGETGEAEIVQGPARVFNPSESAEMFGGSEAPKVIINGDIVQKPGDTRDPVEVLLGDRRVKAYIEKTARDTRATGRQTPGGR